MVARWTPPVSLSSASDKTSFAYESTVKRWPTILTGIIDELARINGSLLAPEDDDKVKESKELISKLAELIYEMRHDRELPLLPATGLPDDITEYNAELESARSAGTPLRWFNASWLYAECYMYRRVRGLFASTSHWATFDCFASQKIEAFRSSSKGIHTLATAVAELVKKGKTDDEAVLHADWQAMLEVCLWGNATDLSLLTSLTHEQIQELQSVERGSKFVLKDDFLKSWEHIKSLKDARIDIVLDNSGFELFSDLVLADWLLTLSPYASEVVFHPKLMPWFVSDVQPHDFTLTLSSLLDPTFFPSTNGATEEEKVALKEMVQRWQRYVDEGKFRLSTPLDLQMGDKGGELADSWTTAYPYSDLPEKAPALLAELQKSSLVIFKGDLNYRKLTSDANWSPTTPFETALGPLRGLFPLLSLRTCKADVCVGLAEGRAEELDQEDPKWRINGKYAVVSFVPRE
ncbi:DUF89-domain-containing protein [Leucosporidium creatinivorum]|uniref:Sugar phosphate phosphatase n=1 Tax=Leucosporidium creatinivorum TaxID=106004 RepID=A0A1Y2ENJ9_9BASI|nr:DUF89-domain-containing protein [Leucosporidium creatinivorum]